MVGARSTPRSLAPQGGGYARAARPRPRLPLRLPLLTLLVLVLVALVLGQHNTHARRAHGAVEAAAAEAAAPLGDDAAAAELLGPLHELAPREATRRALALLDGLYVPPPPPRGRPAAGPDAGGRRREGAGGARGCALALAWRRRSCGRRMGSEAGCGG